MLNERGRRRTCDTVCATSLACVCVCYLCIQVSTDVGELRQALQAYHRILDLLNKFVDVEVYTV